MKDLIKKVLMENQDDKILLKLKSMFKSQKLDKYQMKNYMGGEYTFIFNNVRIKVDIEPYLHQEKFKRFAITFNVDGFYKIYHPNERMMGDERIDKVVATRLLNVLYRDELNKLKYYMKGLLFVATPKIIRGGHPDQFMFIIDTNTKINFLLHTPT